MLGIAVVGVAFGVWYVWGRSDELARIEREIAKANYCTTSADCAVVTGQCPLGCWVAVHKNEADRIEALVASYESTCVYSCIRHEGAECVQGACQVKLPLP